MLLLLTTWQLKGCRKMFLFFFFFFFKKKRNNKDFHCSCNYNFANSKMKKKKLHWAWWSCEVTRTCTPLLPPEMRLAWEKVATRTRDGSRRRSNFFVNWMGPVDWHLYLMFFHSWEPFDTFLGWQRISIILVGHWSYLQVNTVLLHQPFLVGVVWNPLFFFPSN